MSSDIEIRVKRAMDKMRDGHHIIASDELLDAIAEMHPFFDVVSCYNAQQVGMLDTYVAWMSGTPSPQDMHYQDMRAYGSADR